MTENENKPPMTEREQIELYMNRINEINRFFTTTNEIRPHINHLDLMEERDILNIKVKYFQIRELKKAGKNIKGILE
jgi:hypothetical protein